MVIGRDPQCDQPLDHPMVSWHHARLSRTPHGVVVEDLGSLNGTFVDGALITGKVLIGAGQEVGVGGVRFQLLESGGSGAPRLPGQRVDPGGRRDGEQPGRQPLARSDFHDRVPVRAGGVDGSCRCGQDDVPESAQRVHASGERSRAVQRRGPVQDGTTCFGNRCGYVPQDDIVHSQLTVREALYFSARLRTDLSDKEIDARIDTILDALGILDKKRSLIGSPERKVLSGGQRKRVNIALELISDTPVLFLDEPTSGLSSYDAAGVIDLLKRLSQQGKTIVATIHQPSVDVFRKFDNLIMISRDPGGCGALAYFGPAYPDSIKFFHDGASEFISPGLQTGIARSS